MKAEIQKNKLPEQKNLFKVAFIKFRKSSTTVKIVEFIIIIGTIIVPMLITDTKPYVWMLLSLISLGLIYFAYIYAKEYNLIVKTTIIIATSCVVIIAGLIYTAKILTVNDPCKKPETLHDYFECADFAGIKYRISTKGEGGLINIFTGDTVKVEYERKLFIDIDNMTYFFTFYCHNEKMMIPFCFNVPQLVDQVLNDENLKRNAIPNIYRDKAKSLDDLTFTRQIYIYLDDVVNAQQEQEIRDTFKKHKPELTSILRTRLYLMFKEHKYENIPE